MALSGRKREVCHQGWGHFDTLWFLLLNPRGVARVAREGRGGLLPGLVYVLPVTFLVALAGDLIPELKAESSIQGHPWVHSESERTLDFMKLSKRKKKKKKK